jgi:uncharacterized protein YjiS (DUF1127 family)
MVTLKMISEKISAWLRNRQAMREWSQYSDHELRHIRIRRSDIEDVRRRQGRCRAVTRALSQCAHNMPAASPDG